jgi:outer membrane protein OmpA-like peptidoglycan-associated protein
MPTRFLVRALGVILIALASSQQADAQIFKKLKKTVTDAAGSEVLTQTDRLVRDKVRCVFDDIECIHKAEESGEEAILTDDSGEVLVDDKGEPVSDPEKGAELAQEKQLKPGEGAWANYDFVPGDQILVYEDFTKDKVGDFPHRFELVSGNWEIVDWEGGRYLRATANGLVAIPLPQTLPERFTLELSINLQHGGAFARLTTGRAWFGTIANYRGSAVSIEPHRAGLRPVRGAGPESMGTLPPKLLLEEMVPIRVMADGDHMRVYVNEQRVANAPNAVFPRTDTLFLALNAARVQQPIMIGTIRIAGGGRDLYDRLAKEGRVATQGILFASNSDRIRPESTPTLEEIGTMLNDHPDLRIAIEGHTDSDGEDDYNQTLSERRAAAVTALLVEAYGISEARLQAGGFGESRPVADNATPEGKQQNRRVELVRLER